MNKNNIWFITAKTNLHVGNENTSSYGLIDLAVQRNVTTGLPCINSSSLKGALNEYAAKEAMLESKDLIKIFGSDKVKENGKSRNPDTQKGQYTFFDANILFLPVQSDTNLYELVTCDAVLNRFFKQVKLMTGKDITENDLLDFKYTKTIKGVVVTEEKFIELCSDDNLPIIARNVLENGESKNLWYEQVVPAETVFYTIIDDEGDNLLASKIAADKKDDKKTPLIQIGANATIGYGYCKFTNLK